MLIEANSKPHIKLIHMNGSVTRDWCDWGFTVKQDRRTVQGENSAHRVMTSSLTMKVEAVTHVIQWLASQSEAQITHTIIFTDSMNLLHKNRVWDGLPQLAHSHTQSLAAKTSVDLLPWACCSQRDEWTDTLASTVEVTSGQLGRAEVFRGLRNFRPWTAQCITASITWRKEE